MAGIKRACTYAAAITTPEPPDQYSEIVVTFAQDQEVLVQKNISELELTETGVIVRLTQAETKQFRPYKKSPLGAKLGGPAYMQIRAYKDELSAPGSKCWAIDVHDSLSEEVLGNG